MAEKNEEKGSKKDTETKKEDLRFDSSRLNEVSEGDKEFEQDLIVLYKSTCEEKLPLLEKALRESDQKNSILFSHDTKGASASIGAEAVRKISEKMEMMSKDGEYQEALLLFPKLKAELKETYKVLEKYVGIEE